MIETKSETKYYLLNVTRQTRYGVNCGFTDNPERSIKLWGRKSDATLALNNVKRDQAGYKDWRGTFYPYPVYDKYRGLGRNDVLEVREAEVIFK